MADDDRSPETAEAFVQRLIDSAGHGNLGSLDQLIHIVTTSTKTNVRDQARTGLRDLSARRNIPAAVQDKVNQALANL